MDEQKVLTDWEWATREAIYTLNRWLGCLERWRREGRVEGSELAEGGRMLREAGLGGWAAEAGGQGLEALAGVAAKAERG